MGDAVTATLLLSDWERYGLSERVSYHFDLTEALASTTVQPQPATVAPLNADETSGTDVDAAISNQNSNNVSEAEGPSSFSNFSGVVGMIECVPFTPLNRLTKRQKRALRNDIRDFNLACVRIREAKRVSCHQPRRLPLRLNPASRLFFAYEVTRIVFCLDASPTLTSTFGSMDNDMSECCPMDRVASMARAFFKALVEPIEAPSIPIQKVWRPTLEVTVIAVYPRGTGLPQTSLLVRGFQVCDLDSAELLAQKIAEWVLRDVESEIARRLSTRSRNNLLHGYDAWSIQLHSSSLRDIMDAGDISLSILSSAAKPCIVVATDGRSVSCDGVMDILADADRSDVPLVVLDLSSPQSHSQYSKDSSEGGTRGRYDQLSLIQYGLAGQSTFPLHLSDDTEALHGICRATGGCFFDAELLQQGAQTKAGQMEDSPFHVDHYFSFKRRSLKPNAVQWYLLFSLSPLSPTFNSSWGQSIPPKYLRHKPQLSANLASPTERRSLPWSSTNRQSPTNEIRRIDSATQRKPLSRTTFSTYIVNPIRIKGLLMMRVKEGYRARQYGQSTQDTDKVLIQFNLPLELGTVLHYELSYKALPNQSHMVGVAHIKIELSGEQGFIQSVKNDFLRQSHVGRPVTMANQVSARLCRILRWIRREDCLQSYLCPLRWSDQLADPETPFVRRLRTLTNLQRRKHFRFDQFDVVCTGKEPFALDDGFLSEFFDLDNGEQALLDTVSKWSSQTIREGSQYVKRTDTLDGNLANYCIIELAKSETASRLYTISVEFFGGTGACERLELLALLKEKLSKLKDVEVLSKQMAGYLVGLRKQNQLDSYLQWKRSLLENQHHHASWDLVKDPELLPLLMKRRAEIGHFMLLDSSDDHALFAKLVPSSRQRNEDLIQYQIAIRTDRVVIDLHMESTCGYFFPFRPVGDDNQEVGSESKHSLKNLMFHLYGKTLKRRDQECGRALRCRTALLKVFKEHGENLNDDDESELSCVQRLLPYANKVKKKLRFFNNASSANAVLQRLSEDMLLLPNSSGVRVARLPINPNKTVCGIGNGSWFIIRLDHHTMSIVHYGLLDQRETDEDDAEGVTYRELTFFTIGTSDLYSQRDDVVDDDSTDSHISEYLSVVEFADNWDCAHKNIYATAAYAALKHCPVPAENFHPDDLCKVLSVCDFIEVASVLVGGTPISDRDGSQETESKLKELIFTILGQVGGFADQYTLFYYRRSEEDDVVLLNEQETDSLSAFDKLDGVTDLELEEEEHDQDRTARSLDDLSLDADIASRSDDEFDRQGGSSHEFGKANTLIAQSDVKMHLSPPLFVRFTLDGELANLDDLSSIAKSATLAAQLSVFKEDGRRISRLQLTDHSSHLPAVHGKVAVELVALMNAYVAEQSLERLRHFGHELTEDDLYLVKGCLRGARNVIKSRIDVYFYNGKIDAMVPALAPAGGELAIEHGFELLKSELEKNESIAVRAFIGDVFVAMESKDTVALDFWCFINLRRTHISVKVHHSEGSDMALAVMGNVQEMISHCCHRVNQQLLLASLHQSRSANELLIPKDVMVVNGPKTDSELLFQPGVFICPVVFRTSFDLFHRCATNPSQVARKLEGTVLHSFAVSNRRNVFVYKDETGDVFYMMLESRGGGVDPDGIIDLLVYGIQDPGPSITIQLTQLLRRRLQLIAVDMLSAVLTKNPHFHWKRADLDFIRCFKADSRSPDETQYIESEQIAEYEFPRCVRADPGMILLDFRQNLCGSTFFHRLNESTGEAKQDIQILSDDEGIDFNSHDFTFYYNNSPSKLDPKFQSVSTLTERGAEYCRQAGAGIAIITVSLIYSSGEPIERIQFGLPLAETETAQEIQHMSLLTLKAGCAQDRGAEADGVIRIRVEILSTALKLPALHGWVLLTLNQAYSAWRTERHLERMQRGLIIPSPLPSVAVDGRATSDESKMLWIGSLCPGLPILNSLIVSIHDLPHPAFVKTVSEGVIRASSVASVAMDFIEGVVSLSVAEARKTGSSPPIETSDIIVIRLSRSGKPTLVRLDYDFKREVIVRALQHDEKGAILRDKPIECPEYICFLCDPKYGETKGETLSRLPMLFKEVVVDDGNSDRSLSIARLEKLKESNPHFFFRSNAFIFSVKRNIRTFLSYNFAPQAAKAVTSRLLEKDRALLKNADNSTDTLQLRSLKLLSPLSAEGAAKRAFIESENVSSQGHDRNMVRGHDEINASGGASSSAELGQKPRASRPTFIRRPKLIGKSVEGAAMQAVAASRARASNKQRFARGSATSASAQSQLGQRDDDTSEITRASTARKEERPPLDGPPQQKMQTAAQVDESLTAARRRLDSLLSRSATVMRQRSSQHWSAVQRLGSLWWPSNEQATIPRSVIEFILSQSPRAWSFAREIPPMPPRLLKSFVLSLAQTIRMWHPDIALLPVPLKDVGSNNSVLLMGEMKGVRSCRCMAIFKISMHQFGGKGRQINILRSQGWVATLRRHKAGHEAKLSMDFSHSERDSAAFDKLTTELHYGALDLDCLLIDFVGFVIERVMKSLDSRLVNADTIPLIRNLFHRYPLKRQHTLSKLNYRVFRCTIVLSSYQNRLISLYKAPLQYDWLCNNVSDTGLISCGPEGLCFKKEIVLPNGIHSICFLTCDKSEPKEMQLWLVSRTQGKDLLDYMFRNGSNYAYSILDNIAADAAGLAYEELRIAARDLRRNDLWTKISRVPKTKADRPTREEVDELLAFASSMPLLNRLGPNDRQNVLLVLGSGLDWPSCCAAMEKEPSFSPYHEFTSDLEKLYLFFIKNDDFFLLIRLSRQGELKAMDLVSQDESAFKEGKDTVVIQKLTNYLLSFLWLSI